LEYAIADMGRSQAELAQIVGSRARASEILGRKRALTIAMIDKISEAWGVPRGLLAVPYRLMRDVA
jgi:HTH-type transcriptional regulator/antitoxin HigA